MIKAKSASAWSWAAVPVPVPVPVLILAALLAAVTWAIPAGALPGGITAWVPNFTLWDAARDLQVSASWGSEGAIIPDTLRRCAAIEIRPPEYEDGTYFQPGSLRLQLDGVGQGCGNGTPYDNTPPFGWDTDGGGTHEYACAAALAVVGTHTLSVTPYVGKSCSGARGTTTTIQFDVEGPGTPETVYGTWINGLPRRLSCATLNGEAKMAPMTIQIQHPAPSLLWETLPVLDRVEFPMAPVEWLKVGMPSTGSGTYETRCAHGDVPGEPIPLLFPEPGTVAGLAPAAALVAGLALRRRRRRRR